MIDVHAFTFLPLGDLMFIQYLAYKLLEYITQSKLPSQLRIWDKIHG